MQSKNNVPDYNKIIANTRTSRIVNIVLSSVGIAACAACVVLLLNTAYLFFAASSAFIAVVVLLSLIFKSLRDIKSTQKISDDAVYAALLDADQHLYVRRYILRRAQLFYFTAFIVIIMPEAAVLSVMYYLFQNSVYLFFLGVVAVFCLVCVILALLYLSARLTVADMMIVVSGSGIMAGNEVISFDAKKKEAVQLLRFSDYYYLKFVKNSVLGIKHLSEIIFPVDGSLRKGLSGSPDEELAIALALDDVFVTEDDFYESKSYLDGDIQEDIEEPQPEAPKKKTYKADPDTAPESDRAAEDITPSPKKEIYSTSQFTMQLDPIKDADLQVAPATKKKTYKNEPEAVADTVIAAEDISPSPKKKIYSTAQFTMQIDPVADPGDAQQPVPTTKKKKYQEPESQSAKSTKKKDNVNNLLDNDSNW